MNSGQKSKLTIREMAVFSMLAAVMYASKVIMDVLPNIHLIGIIISAMTIAYGKKALWPLYIFVFLTGLINGFATWWLPYLYIWTVLWGGIMLVPAGSRSVVYMIVCALHGYLYGTLYAPAQALIMGLSFKEMLAWIAAGLPFDAIHGTSNFICGFLIMPLSSLLIKLNNKH